MAEEAEEPQAFVDEPAEAVDEPAAAEPEDEPDPVKESVAKAAPGFSKLLDSIAGLTGFYGSQPVKVEPVVGSADEPVAETPVDEEPVAEEPAFQEPVAEEAVEEPVAEEPAAADAVEEPEAVEQPTPRAAERPTPAPEGTLQNKLTDVRAKTNEARLAQIRAQAALVEGLSAAYDFAIDAEESPEEYLRMVEAQGLKIQLRSPMKPVVKLAFDGMCDEMTIKQLEAVLAWALKEELPRGSLAGKIEEAGGLSEVFAKAA
jgi:hypothetical protein